MVKSKDWFEWYCQQLAGNQKKRWASFRGSYLCPCCFMPTLSERGGFDICPLCHWEDDGQDSDGAVVVRGGPNGNYSLAEARGNFKEYLTMYRPDDKHAFSHAKKRHASVLALLHLFQAAIEADTEESWLLAKASLKKIR